MHDTPLVLPHYDNLPVFPLPNFVLFPHTTTALHVFEPRYRLMTADALSRDRLIVLVGLKPGWEEDYYGSPPVFDVGSIVKIVNEQRLDDGRYNLHVNCLGRCRILAFHRLDPYRLAEVETQPDEALDATEVGPALEDLVGCVRGLMLQLGDQAGPLGRVIAATRDPAILTNRLAAALATEPTVRQGLLEVRSPLARAKLLSDLVGEMMLRGHAVTFDDEGAVAN